MRFEIIDRRKNPKGKSLVNRQRFLKRHTREMKTAVGEKIRESDVKDIGSDSPKRIKISPKGTDEAVFRHGDGGVIERVLPGNKEFKPGDTIPRPSGESGNGSQGAPDGDGEDDFVFVISQEEFLHYFFDGLELPDMVKKVLAGDEAFKVQRAGFSMDGTPSNLDPLRTMRQSHARRIAFRMPKLRRKRRLEEEFDFLKRQIESGNGVDNLPERGRLEGTGAIVLYIWLLTTPLSLAELNLNWIAWVIVGVILLWVGLTRHLCKIGCSNIDHVETMIRLPDS